MKHKFIGKPDKKFPFLKTGNIYDLVIEEHKKTLGLFGKKPVIVSPFYCSYSNWISFYKNWTNVYK